MADRLEETDLPRWASTADTRVIEPSSGYKDLGFQAGYRPPAQWVNWLWKKIYLWLAYLRLHLIGAMDFAGYLRCTTLATLGSPDETWTVVVGATRALVLSGVATRNVASASLVLANVAASGDKITESSKTALYPGATYYVYVKDNTSTDVEEYEISRTAPAYGWMTGAEGTKRYLGCFRTNTVSGLSPFSVDVGFPIPFTITDDGWYQYDFGPHSSIITSLTTADETTLTVTEKVLTAYVPSTTVRSGVVKLLIDWTVTTGAGSITVNGVPVIYTGAPGQFCTEITTTLNGNGGVLVVQQGISAGAYRIRVVGFGLKKVQ